MLGRTLPLPVLAPEGLDSLGKLESRSHFTVHSVSIAASEHPKTPMVLDSKRWDLTSSTDNGGYFLSTIEDQAIPLLDSAEVFTSHLRPRAMPESKPLPAKPNPNEKPGLPSVHKTELDAVAQNFSKEPVFALKANELRDAPFMQRAIPCK